MNLTLSQAHERTRDLSGEIKAAREMVTVCADDLEAKEHVATLARQAYDKAKAALADKLAERDALADHMAGLVRTVGDPPPLADETAPAAPAEFNSVFAAPAEEHAARPFDGLHDALLANGEARMNEALDRAREGL